MNQEIYKSEKNEPVINPFQNSLIMVSKNNPRQRRDDELHIPKTTFATPQRNY
jgi:hypothetical protein